ncbi:uncharacterized protein Cpr62Ba isoform X2 [Eurosta solidaginis]
MFMIIIWIIYLELFAMFGPSSSAQTQQSTSFSELNADFKNLHNNDELKYTFNYYIDHPQSMVHLHHREERHGTRTIGEYGLLEPGGHVRKVYYMVDGNGGYRAIVRTRTASSNTHQLLRLRQQQPIKPIQHAQPVAFIN